jgi:hypothetical protein
MLQSLRAVGYDLPTAIADLVDNSISASATSVAIGFHWDGDRSHIAIVDDGLGMAEDDLVTAMRLGSRNPLEERSRGDLGRFGLGLKTASFSQCRRLTVASKPETGSVAVRCWDLNLVTELDEWRLTDSLTPAAQEYVNRLGSAAKGTVVLWELMDRITPRGLTASDAEAHRIFLELAEQTKRHLGMVFHRLLSGFRPLKMQLNGSPVKPWDPFLTGKSIQLTEQTIPYAGERIEVRPYQLPHHSKLSRDEYAEAAGPRGWTAQQGFYVYRGRRMLVAGDWLGLGRYQKEDHHKLARIQLDIPNSMDADWEIDVKKSRACPPPRLRGELKNIADAARAHASRVYRHRGKRIISAAPKTVLLWEPHVNRLGRMHYRLNQDHPVVADVLTSAGPAAKKVRLLLTLVEETVPVPSIAIDSSTDPLGQAAPFEAAPTALTAALKAAFRALAASGMRPSEAKVRLLNTEPFNHYPENVTALGGDDLEDPEPVDADDSF